MVISLPTGIVAEDLLAGTVRGNGKRVDKGQGDGIPPPVALTVPGAIYRAIYGAIPIGGTLLVLVGLQSRWGPVWRRRRLARVLGLP